MNVGCVQYVRSELADDKHESAPRKPRLDERERAAEEVSGVPKEQWRERESRNKACATDHRTLLTTGSAFPLAPSIGRRQREL